MRKIFVSLLVAVVAISPLSILSAQADCTGEAECYGMTPAPVNASHSGWPPDDLNPVQDEYYTVYCHFDQIEVWRAAGGSVQLASIPISRVMGASQPFDAGNGLTASRSEDTVTISGANGNGPIHPGAKSFNLDECFARNGRIPAVPTSTTVEEAQVVASAQSCTYLFGSEGVPPSQFYRLSSAPSVIGSDNKCELPPVGTTCQFVATIDSIWNRAWTIRMPGTVNLAGECDPAFNPVRLIIAFVRALLSLICVGVYAVPFGGVSLWINRLRKARR